MNEEGYTSAFPMSDRLEYGLNKRDYFAGQVIMGFMANSYISEKFDHHNYEELSAGFAKHAYVIADAMIAERERSK